MTDKAENESDVDRKIKHLADELSSIEEMLRTSGLRPLSLYEQDIADRANRFEREMADRQAERAEDKADKLRNEKVWVEANRHANWNRVFTTAYQAYLTDILKQDHLSAAEATQWEARAVKQATEAADAVWGPK